MAEARTLARPYAQAVFNKASEDDSFEQWSEALNFLKVVTENQSMKRIIGNPDIQQEQVISVYQDIAKDSLDEKGINFLKVTAENGRLELIPEIADFYEEMQAERSGSIDALVISAFAVSAAQKKTIAEALKKKFSCEVTIKTETDKSLIGGIIIRAGDVVIDGSVKTELEKITHALLV